MLGEVLGTKESRATVGKAGSKKVRVKREGVLKNIRMEGE